jgi:hypothetical protein
MNERTAPDPATLCGRIVAWGRCWPAGDPEDRVEMALAQVVS